MYFFGWFAGRRSGDSFAIKKGFVCLLSVVKGDRKHNVLKCKMFENHPQTYNILHHYNGTFKVNVFSEKFLILIVKHKTNSKWENLIRMSEFLTFPMIFYKWFEMKFLRNSAVFILIFSLAASWKHEKSIRSAYNQSSYTFT